MPPMSESKPDPEFETKAQPSWSVTLTPHRSLSREGFLLIMVLLVAINLVCGIFFLVVGAWPVFGFMGLDVLLMWWAFRRNFSDGRKAEQIIITGDHVLLRRLAENGESKDLSFNRRWLRIDLAFDEEREIVGSLCLVSHGRKTEIGSFLGAEERLSIAAALRDAIRL